MLRSAISKFIISLLIITSILFANSSNILFANQLQNSISDDGLYLTPEEVLKLDQKIRTLQEQIKLLEEENKVLRETITLFRELDNVKSQFLLEYKNMLVFYREQTDYLLKQTDRLSKAIDNDLTVSYNRGRKQGWIESAVFLTIAYLIANQ